MKSGGQTARSAMSECSDDKLKQFRQQDKRLGNSSHETGGTQLAIAEEDQSSDSSGGLIVIRKNGKNSSSGVLGK